MISAHPTAPQAPPRRPSILVVEDERDLLELIAYNLAREGFEVRTSQDGEDALMRLRAEPADLVVLDLMLPGIQGMELLRIMREDRRTAPVPVILLTARTEETDRVLGLEMGADDYIGKPFSPRELVARVRAVLRRSSSEALSATPPQPGRKIFIGELEIDTETYTVTKRGEALQLSATEFRLLRFLAENRGKVYTRDRILDSVWRDEAFVEPRTVDVHIRRLRSQVEDDPSSPRYIRTRRGVGYFVETDT
jgi:DNA-binding response OmpR family regulator